MNRETIGIIGLGLMGKNIAVACARAGYRVVASDSLAGRVRAFIESTPELSDRIFPAETFESFASCAVVIEAIVENLETKLETFSQLEVLTPHVTIASNSSTFMPSELASRLSDKGRLLVCHFFNPANIVPLVEIVPSPFTDQARINWIRNFVRTIGKKPVLLNREVEGFVANRLQAALLRECFALVERGIASPETIDEVVRFSLAPRWAANGPIATADLGGLDIFSALSNRLFPLLDRSTSAQESLHRHVHNGELGAKVGAGFYNWSEVAKTLATDHLTEFFLLGNKLSATNGDVEHSEPAQAVAHIRSS